MSDVSRCFLLSYCDFSILTLCLCSLLRAIDDKYSRREEYRGFTQDFKEKDGYKPDIKIEYVDESGRKLTPKEVRASSYCTVARTNGSTSLAIMRSLFFLRVGFQTAISSFPWQRVWKDEDWEKNEKTGGGSGTFFRPPTKPFGPKSVMLRNITGSCQEKNALSVLMRLSGRACLLKSGSCFTVAKENEQQWHSSGYCSPAAGETEVPENPLHRPQW